MRQRVEPASGREKLLHATIALLLEAGIHGTQTRAVTERAGVGTGLLNHYFRWPELRASAWTAIFADLVADMRRDDETPGQALDRFFSQTFADDARAIWRLWIEAENLSGGDPCLAASLAAARASLRDALTDLLTAGSASGSWRLAAPAQTALRLEAMRDGLAGMILSGDPDVDAGTAERHLRTLFEMERRDG